MKKIIYNVVCKISMILEKKIISRYTMNVDLSKSVNLEGKNYHTPDKFSPDKFFQDVKIKKL